MYPIVAFPPVAMAVFRCAESGKHIRQAWCILHGTLQFVCRASGAPAATAQSSATKPRPRAQTRCSVAASLAAGGRASQQLLLSCPFVLRVAWRESPTAGLTVRSFRHICRGAWLLPGQSGRARPEVRFSYPAMVLGQTTCQPREDCASHRSVQACRREAAHRTAGDFPVV